jgi:hypothetical protein
LRSIVGQETAPPRAGPRAYQDVVAWLEIKNFTPTTSNLPTIAYQTSPTKDDALFFNMAAPITAAVGVTTTAMLKDAMPPGYPPCAKWFRWQIVVSGAVAWDLTFRIWIAANLIGNRVALSPATTLSDLEDEGYRYGYGECPPTSSSTPSQSTVPQGGGNGIVDGGGGVVQTNQTSGGGKGPSGKIQPAGIAGGGKWYLDTYSVVDATQSNSGGVKRPPNTP